MSEEHQSEQPQRGSSVFERHAQTLVGALVLGVVLWLGATVQSLVEGQIRLETQMAGVQAQLVATSAQLELTGADRYTGTMADRDFRIVADELSDMRSRLRALENERRSDN